MEKPERKIAERIDSHVISVCEMGAAPNDCEGRFNCCDCGGDADGGCGCNYCWSCNACDTCREK